jgi:radical SAM superfamily enzyme
MFDYHFPLYRPPAEANNLIIQVTLGCSHNNCTFCSMYKSKKYLERPLDELKKEIDEFSSIYPNTIKIFLADGDALSAPTKYLLEILQHLQQKFPKLRRVSCYASATNILDKNEKELTELKNNKLTLIYYGIETGSDTLLKKINKGVNAQDMIDSLNLASKVGIKISATIILGLGGKEYSKEHIEQSAKLINQTNITYLSTLQLGLDEDVKDKFYKPFTNFKHLDDMVILQEQKEFISKLHPQNKIIFRSNHASNALPLLGNLPKDKERLIATIDLSIEMGEESLVPKMLRSF